MALQGSTANASEAKHSDTHKGSREQGRAFTGHRHPKVTSRTNTKEESDTLTRKRTGKGVGANSQQGEAHSAGCSITPSCVGWTLRLLPMVCSSSWSASITPRMMGAVLSTLMASPPASGPCSTRVHDQSQGLTTRRCSN